MGVRERVARALELARERVRGLVARVRGRLGEPARVERELVSRGRAASEAPSVSAPARAPGQVVRAPDAGYAGRWISCRGSGSGMDAEPDETGMARFGRTGHSEDGANRTSRESDIRHIPDTDKPDTGSPHHTVPTQRTTGTDDYQAGNAASTYPVPITPRSNR